MPEISQEAGSFFGSLPLSYQLRMSFNRLFDPLRLNADVPLRDSGGAVLSDPPTTGKIRRISAVPSVPGRKKMLQ
jgi:hypothetical protein